MKGDGRTALKGTIRPGTLGSLLPAWDQRDHWIMAQDSRSYLRELHSPQPFEKLVGPGGIPTT